MRVTALPLAVLVLSGCSSCGAAAPRASGPTPYVRCFEVEPPDGRRIGSLSLDVQGREANLEGVEFPLRVAAVRGPAPFPSTGEEEVEALRASGARLALILGSFGDSPEAAHAFFNALQRAEIPMLILSGGRDHARADLPGDATNLVLVDGLSRIRLGAIELVPVPGAPDGRYARDDESCGFSEDDLRERAERLGAPADRVRRILLSWSAPSAAGLSGFEYEAPQLAGFARDTGATFGLHAWPDGCAGNESAPGLCVGRASGMALVRGDGSRVPAAVTILTLEADGRLTIGSS